MPTIAPLVFLWLKSIMGGGQRSLSDSPPQINTNFLRLLPLLLQTLRTVSPETPRWVSLEALRTLLVEALREMSVGALPEHGIILRNP